MLTVETVKGMKIDLQTASSQRPGVEAVCGFPYLHAFIVLTCADSKAYLKARSGGPSDHFIGVAQWVYGHSIPALLLMLSAYC